MNCSPRVNQALWEVCIFRAISVLLSKLPPSHTPPPFLTQVFLMIMYPERTILMDLSTVFLFPMKIYCSHHISLIWFIWSNLSRELAYQYNSQPSFTLKKCIKSLKKLLFRWVLSINIHLIRHGNCMHARQCNWKIK